ncbi:GNAT family N-acetyltransferase [Salirhabdus salicampi]|uniref:GNAT family N-acetyltransferase n=1 Tax=Salirhabdus salicampi TaxID=476102 RepID=UPI0020C366E5|nr:GNAT family N-acetyltransferase [Salirhabdus salicampi]MCP8616184.1 GNAT family N-acetyltransferase [Salirhabdus salicampi]
MYSKKHIEIRVLSKKDELTHIDDLQQNIWNMTPIPVHHTLTASQNGGLILGAYNQDQIIGFSFSFPGYKHNQIYLCSHMLGIDPAFQEHGVGTMLKEEQRKQAKQMGYSLISWTFDPLQSRNAYLNLSKLGAICSTYIENCYGTMNDSLNKGLPTDRFKVEWWIDRELSRGFVHSLPEETVIEWELNDQNLPRLQYVKLEDLNLKDGLCYTVPIPMQFHKIKSRNQALAYDWRMKIREIFQYFFNNGYAVISLEKADNGHINYYKLVKRTRLKIDKVW